MESAAKHFFQHAPRVRFRSSHRRFNFFHWAGVVLENTEFPLPTAVLIVGHRRYYRRRKRDDDETGLEVLLSLAYLSPIAGAIIVVVLGIIALVCYAHPKAMYGTSRIWGMLALIVAAPVVVAAFLGIVCRAFGGTAQRIRSDLSRRRVSLPPTSSPLSTRVRASSSPSVPMPVTPSPSYPMHTTASPVGSMLSKGEMAFYIPLCEIVSGRFTVQVKPSLADVLQCRDEPRWKDIASMHVDFVLCDVRTLRPCLVIELDDRSHRYASRRPADRWKEELLASRQVPLLRQPNQSAYDIQALREAILSRLTPSPP